MAKFLYLAATLVVLALPQWSSAVDFNGAKEGSCFDVNTTSLDMDWVRSVKPWYTPIGSRSDLYQTSASLLKRPYEEIPENYIYYMACLMWQMDVEDQSASLSGYDGHRALFKIKYTEGMEKIDFYLKDGGEMLASCQTTYTDNKTFYMNVCCLKGDEIVWGVNSVTPTLPEDIVKMLQDMAEEMGFDRKQFTGLRYDTCIQQQ